MVLPSISEFYADSKKWNALLKERKQEECEFHNQFWIITEGMDMRTGPIKTQDELRVLWKMRDPSYDPKTTGLVLVNEILSVFLNSFPPEGTFLVFSYPLIQN